MSLCPHDHVGVGKVHRGCRSPGKSPFFPNMPPDRQNLWKHHQTERATENDVRGWWSLGHELNVGVALGPISGIVAIDIDDEDGETLLQDLSAGDVPRTWEYTTGKGRRLIYKLPEGVHVRSTPFARIGTQIEILRFMGAGSQIVLPPSIHPNGAKYRWSTGKSSEDIEPASVPEWMITARHTETEAKRINEGELIDEGGRNNFLTSLAGSIRKHGAHEDVIYAALSQMNSDRCNPPLPEADVRKICRSILRYPPDEFSGVSIKQAKPVEMKTVAEDGRMFQWFGELKMPDKADEWLWEGYLPRAGIVLMSALWKAGKTTLMAHLLKALGSDGMFLGQKVKASKILYVSEEGVQHWVKRRDQLGIGNYAALYSQPFDVRPDTPQWIQFVGQLRLDVEKYGFDLVVIDTLAKLWPVREENNAVDVDSALMPLGQITKAGAGVLLIHHMRKSGGSEYTGSRGSGALSAFPDIVVELTRFDAMNQKCTKRVLKAKGRYDETPDELSIELINGQYHAITSQPVHDQNGNNGSILTVIGDSEEARIIKVLSICKTTWLTIDGIREGLRATGKGIRNGDVTILINALVLKNMVSVTGKKNSPQSPRMYAVPQRAAILPTPPAPYCRVGDEYPGGVETDSGVLPKTHPQDSSPLETQGRDELGEVDPGEDSDQ